MFRSVLLAVSSALALGAMPLVQVEAQEPQSYALPGPMNQEVLVEALRQMNVAFSAGEEDLANSIGDAILRDPVFVDTSQSAESSYLDMLTQVRVTHGGLETVSVRGVVLTQVALVRVHTGRNDEGLALAEMAAAISAPSDQVARALIVGNFHNGDYIAAGEAVRDYAAADPRDFLAGFSGYLFELQSALRVAGEAELRRDVLEFALRCFRLEPEGRSYPIMRYLLADMLWDAGEDDKARGLFAEETDVTAIARLRTDRRYERLWAEPDFDAIFDVEAALAADIERLEALVEYDRTILLAWMDLIYHQIAGLHDTEAFALAQEAFELFQNSEAMQAQTAGYPWFFAAIAQAYYYAGDIDGGNAVFEYALELRAEMIVRNDLAGLYLRQLVWQGANERAARLLETHDLERRFAVSDGTVISMSMCVARGLGDRAGAEALRPALVALWESSPMAVIRGYYCLGDEAAMRAGVLEIIETPEMRQTALRFAHELVERRPENTYLVRRDYDRLMDEILTDQEIARRLEAIARPQRFNVRAFE